MHTIIAAIVTNIVSPKNSSASKFFHPPIITGNNNTIRINNSVKNQQVRPQVIEYDMSI